jgi:DNA-binding winged helix-turn-helix (wHTH) protein
VEFRLEEPRVIAFGAFRLDRESGRLLRGDENVPLRHKTFAVLEYLALRPGRLVTRDELLDAVWPGTHVTPSVLAGCIVELRRALDDDAKAARFIETAHRRGYRFVGTPPVDEPPAPPRRMPRGETELAELARKFARAVAHIVRRRVGRAAGRRRSRPRRSGQSR